MHKHHRQLAGKSESSAHQMATDFTDAEFVVFFATLSRVESFSLHNNRKTQPGEMAGAWRGGVGEGGAAANDF